MSRFLKFGLILLFLAHHFFVVGQVKTDWRISIDSNLIESDLKVDIDRILIDGGNEELGSDRYVGITHTPSVDFNIYLTFNNAINSRIQTSFEVSLNYSGVMNIRSTIALRRRER